jgi:hypothetical protein
MLMPAVLELRKPKGAGPRLIMSEISQVLSAQAVAVDLMDLEENHELYITIKPSVKVILGNLPALYA